jgi:hypothetical protein
MSKTPVDSGVLFFALFIIAGGLKLIRQANVLDWRWFLVFGGLTGFKAAEQVRGTKQTADPLRGRQQERQVQSKATGNRLWVTARILIGLGWEEVVPCWICSFDQFDLFGLLSNVLVLFRERWRCGHSESIHSRRGDECCSALCGSWGKLRGVDWFGDGCCLLCLCRGFANGWIRCRPRNGIRGEAFGEGSRAFGVTATATVTADPLRG